MAITVNRIVVYTDFIDQYTIENYQINRKVDYPYLSGEVINFIPFDDVKRMDYSNVKVSLFNGSGYGKMIVNVGAEGLCYLKLRPEYWIEKLIVEPDDIISDIYYGDEGLIYSFYNPTSRESIGITIQIGEDVEGAFRDIATNPTDLHLRQYYIRRALVKTNTSLIQKPVTEYPENMTVDDVSHYLNVQAKTIQNWTYEGKIPYVKLGSAVRYPRTKIDDAMAKGEIGKTKKK